jgi:hypothetical protein
MRLPTRVHPVSGTQTADPRDSLRRRLRRLAEALGPRVCLPPRRAMGRPNRRKSARPARSGAARDRRQRCRNGWAPRASSWRRKVQGGGSTLETFFCRPTTRRVPDSRPDAYVRPVPSFDRGRQAVDQASGYTAIWRDGVGTLQVAFYGYAPIRTGGAGSSPSAPATGSSPRLTRADANEGAIPTRLVNASLAQSTGGSNGRGEARQSEGLRASSGVCAACAETDTVDAYGRRHGNRARGRPAPSVPATSGVTRTGALASPGARGRSVVEERHSVFVSANDAALSPGPHARLRPSSCRSLTSRRQVTAGTGRRGDTRRPLRSFTPARRLRPRADRRGHRRIH